MTAKCPTGKKVLGTGGDIVAPVAGGGNVAMDSILPNETLTDVTVSAVETSELGWWGIGP